MRSATASASTWYLPAAMRRLSSAIFSSRTSGALVAACFTRANSRPRSEISAFASEPSSARSAEAALSPTFERSDSTCPRFRVDDASGTLAGLFPVWLTRLGYLLDYDEAFERPPVPLPHLHDVAR